MKLKIIPLILAVAMLLSSCGTAGSDGTSGNAVGSQVRLEKVEGTALLFGDSGESVAVFDGVPLFKGYVTETESESFAYISLDASKAVKLDEVSAAEIVEHGKKLEVFLKNGNLFFNVTKPIGEDETLNIAMSTMVMGIRGTSGVIRCGEDSVPTVYILDGKVDVTASDAVTEISAGNKAEILTDTATGSTEIVLSPLTEAEIDSFAAEEIRKDKDLQKRISDETNLNLERILSGEARREKEAELAVAPLVEEIKNALKSSDAKTAFELINSDEFVSFLESQESRKYDDGNGFMAGWQDNSPYWGGAPFVELIDATKGASGLWDNGKQYILKYTWHNNALGAGLELIGFTSFESGRNTYGIYPVFSTAEISGGKYALYESKDYLNDWSVWRSDNGTIASDGSFTGTSTTIDGRTQIYTNGYSKDTNDTNPNRSAYIPIGKSSPNDIDD